MPDTNQKGPTALSEVTIVGAGVIGVSWARLFATAGWRVRITDPRPDLQDIVDEHLDGRDVLVVTDLADAADGTDFVQEAGPERIDIKQQVFATLAQSTRDGVVLASSSSSLPASSWAAGNPAADRCLVGHPFNPPELMPLVEVVPSPQTSTAAVERAVAVYTQLGKAPIALQREIPGFVGNRLQKVFNEQAYYLVQQGVITVKDLDKLVRASLGLRWATVGPFESNVLGGGPGGIRHLASGAGAEMTFENGAPDPAQMLDLIENVESAYGTGEEAYGRLAQTRDIRTAAVLKPLGWSLPAKQ